MIDARGSLLQKLVCEGGKAGEEFVETEYYRDLGCVGKQHHTVTAFSLLAWLFNCC